MNEKCYEWIEYDGMNPPTDTTRHVLWEYEVGGGVVYSAIWRAVWRKDKKVPNNYLRYMYIEPYQPPLPTCAVCGKRPIVFIGNVVVRAGCMEHGYGVGTTEAEACENWRKMRGKE